MVRMIMCCKREIFSVYDLKRLQLEFQEELSLFTSTKLKTPNSSNIMVIYKRTIPDAAHVRRHGRLWLYGLQFRGTGLRQDSCGVYLRRTESGGPVLIRRIQKRARRQRSLLSFRKDYPYRDSSLV